MNRILPLFFLIIAMLVSAVAARAADWEGVFQGTLGKSRILVQLVEPLDDMEGETGRETSRYSYLPKTRDLNLILTAKAMPLVFDETLLTYWEFGAPLDGDKKTTGQWSLSVEGDLAKGTWTSPDGKKKLPIALTRVALLDEAAKDPDDNIVNATYTAQWLKEVTFADAGPGKTFGDVEVRFVKDSAFGIQYPVLGNFPDVVRKDKINALLLSHHLRSVEEYRECKNGVPLAWESENPEPELAYEVAFASPTLLSVTESGSVFCGGAHPSNYVKPITYDLTTPQRIGGTYDLDLSPDGFGRVLKLATKDERIAFERFALGRWNEAAAKDTEMAADCAAGFMEGVPEGARNFSLSFTDKGLAVLRTDYPHVASVCLATDSNPTLIPWADLQPWLKPGQTLVP